MAKITNPEKQCKKTPESFNGVSKIVEIEKTEDYRGIVFDNPEEFGQALIVYGVGSVEGSTTTQDNDMIGIVEDHGIMAGGLLAMVGSSKSSSDFCKNLAKKAISSLKSNGSFHESFEYTFNNFQKTNITGKKVGNKYILELSAAYVGTEPETKLAETIEKPMALIGSNINAKLNIVDDWWFNLNLEEIIRNLPLTKRAFKEIGEWTKYLVSGGYGGKAPEFEFKNKDRKFNLDIGLNVDRHLRPDGEREIKYIQARGNYIVGGSWTTWDKTGNKKISPRAVIPSIILSVSLPGKRYLRPPAVTTDEKNKVMAARNYLIDLISSNQKN